MQLKNGPVKFLGLSIKQQFMSVNDSICEYMTDNKII